MSDTNVIDFWYSIGSTYSYLSVMRVEQVTNDRGVTFRWRPFNVRARMAEVGNVPFRGKPLKLAYMWRDIERRAAMYGIPLRVPAPYPLQDLDLANRVAIVGQREGWRPEYTQATFRRWFQDNHEAGSEPNLSESLREIDQDPARVIALAKSDEIGAAYEAATNEARQLGIFGSPTFVVENELFWGDDRLDDAISWSHYGCVRIGG